jgi:putative metallohydrolase (TIGR04338 family)
MAGTKPRDSQRQRLYDAQSLAGFYEIGEVMTIKEAQKFVNQVLSHKKTRTLFNQYRFVFGTFPSKILVEVGNGSHATITTRDWETVRLIRLNKWGRNKFIVLHEIAHHITWGRESHGAEFADVLLQFTTRYLGKPDADKLANAFNEKRVKVMTKSNKPRVPRKREITSARLVA